MTVRGLGAPDGRAGPEGGTLGTHAVLCWALECCVVKSCVVLSCDVLCCVVLIVICCAVLCWVAWVVLCYVELQWVVLYCIVLWCCYRWRGHVAWQYSTIFSRWKPIICLFCHFKLWAKTIFVIIRREFHSIVFFARSICMQ